MLGTGSKAQERARSTRYVLHTVAGWVRVSANECRRLCHQRRENHSVKPAPTSLYTGSRYFHLEALGGAVVLPPNFHELVARRQLQIGAHQQNTHFLRRS